MLSYCTDAACGGAGCTVVFGAYIGTYVTANASNTPRNWYIATGLRVRATIISSTGPIPPHSGRMPMPMDTLVFACVAAGLVVVAMAVAFGRCAHSRQRRYLDLTKSPSLIQQCDARNGYTYGGVTLA